MNFEACLSLPRDPREAGLIADSLEALARALHEWPAEAWQKLASNPSPAEGYDTHGGLFERMAVRTAESALDAPQRAAAQDSAEAVASVLRVLWPEARARRVGLAVDSTPELVATN
jgi:hypothetical protein